MEPADRNGPGQPAPAGTLDVQAQPRPGGRAVPRPGPRWPAAVRQSWLRLAAGHPVRREAARLAGFIAAGLALTWPRATYLAGYLPSSRDTASYVWGFYWMAHQLTRLANPWFTGHMAAPAGAELGFHTLMPLPGLVMTPVTLTFGPSVSCNLLVLVTPGLLGYAAYRAARLWLPSATGAAAAGGFFGLSAMLTQQAWYHLNIALGALFLPMALEASVRLRRRCAPRQAVILGLVMGAAVLTDQELAVLAAILTALVLLPWLVRHSRWHAWRQAGLAVAAGAALASPQIIAMAVEVARAGGGLAIPSHLLAVSYKQYGIGLPGMFSPSPRVASFGLGALAGPFLHSRDNEGMPMFGTVLSVLALAGLAVSWRRRSAWLLAALWAGCAALALGTTLWVGKHQYIPLAEVWHGVRVSRLMPYTWFVRIPGLSSFREADRMAILGLLPAALLAGSAVSWLRYHARPLLLVVVLVLGIAEAGYAGNARIGVMPASYPAADRGIASDHSSSIVVDIPFGLRGGIPVAGTPFFPQALVMATADGHPRAIAYTARMPSATVTAIEAHPFYRDLIYIQHEGPPACPWALPSRAGQQQPQLLNGCADPAGVAPRRSLLKLPAAQLAAARRDARRLDVGWVVVWKRNNSVQNFVLPYLRATGFRYAYRDGNVLVYRHRGRVVTTGTAAPGARPRGPARIRLEM
jgi:hypothetical protein